MSWFSKSKQQAPQQQQAVQPPIMQQQMLANNIQMPYQSVQPPPLGSTSTDSVPHRLPTKNYKKDLPICSVILTVNTGSSYDGLYREIEQTPPAEGVVISLWQAQFVHLEGITMAINNGNKPDSVTNNQWEVYKEIASDISKAEASSVLLNFECCGGCSDNGFPISSGIVFKLARLFIDRGSSVQFGDFSTKALIHSWDESILGPNPLKKCGEFSSSFDLKFDSTALQACPCAQLAIVGSLCKDKGGAHVHAMGGTVKFTIDYAKADTTAYHLQVLTVMTKADGNEAKGNDHIQVKDETFNGCTGHVMIKYKAKNPVKNNDNNTNNNNDEVYGYMFISAGHWIEISKLDTTVEAVAQVMEKQYGAAKAQEFQMQYKSMAPAAQAAYMQSNAAYIVQSNAVSNYGNMAKAVKKSS